MVLIKPTSLQLGCFVATFTHTFTYTLAKPRADVLFIIHVGDSVFTTAKIGIYTLHALSPCSEIKMTGSYIINI